MTKSIHIGSLIKQFIDKKYLRRTDVAYSMGIPNTAIYAYEKRNSIQTDTLFRLCETLNHNFFMDIANALPKEYTQHSASDKDKLLAEQAKELHKLKLENDLLKELIMNKK
ncbi:MULTISPECIES: helix-turn-helix domain-containing protein [Flavobacterium]|uniref:Helix-turn-helix domain-containing protein n=1 Tax=Flavobacterium jumunjinense TaxID=998845 RepID=A0ABV5GS45_9FLAO|nr:MULTISPECIES: helix-turn-helix transcriptional regulator [Flavobacterium]